MLPSNLSSDDIKRIEATNARDEDKEAIKNVLSKHGGLVPEDSSFLLTTLSESALNALQNIYTEMLRDKTIRSGKQQAGLYARVIGLTIDERIDEQGVLENWKKSRWLSPEDSEKLASLQKKMSSGRFQSFQSIIGGEFESLPPTCSLEEAQSLRCFLMMNPFEEDVQYVTEALGALDDVLQARWGVVPFALSKERDAVCDQNFPSEIQQACLSILENLNNDGKNLANADSDSLAGFCLEQGYGGEFFSALSVTCRSLARARNDEDQYKRQADLIDDARQALYGYESVSIESFEMSPEKARHKRERSASPEWQDREFEDLSEVPEKYLGKLLFKNDRFSRWKAVDERRHKSAKTGQSSDRTKGSDENLDKFYAVDCKKEQDSNYYITQAAQRRWAGPFIAIPKSCITEEKDRQAFQAGAPLSFKYTGEAITDPKIHATKIVDEDLEVERFKTSAEVYKDFVPSKREGSLVSGVER